MGWQVLPLPADHPKGSVICVAPHTSNMDFILWFFFPLGSLFRSLGGIPVNRKERSQTVERIQQLLQQEGQMHIAITPEGTRSRSEKWKSGFYHIAQAAGLPIELAVIDYQKKEVGIFEVFHPTGNAEEDLTYIRQRYRAEQAKHPDQFTP
ncbi:MAG: 1-acyl-sn-glycerol-3-phosphate acyltransferase [Porphyromonadaceae bacterium]|nr:1-acyl-sn-glycerol-3-phosphate acyltransferase [Porphyromonadaceae bacterium]